MSRLCLASLLAIVGTAAQPVDRGRAAEPPIVVTPTMPAALRLLTAPAVQKDVGLTAAQKDDLDALVADWSRTAEDWGFRGFGWMTPAQARTETADRATAFLAKTLTKEQARRVDQIAYQLREKQFGAHVVFAMSARELKLRDDQAEDLPSIQQARVDEITKLVTSGDRFAAVKPKVAASNADTYEKMAEMLTRAQREKLKDLRGKAFVGEVGPEVFRAPAADVPAKDMKAGELLMLRPREKRSQYPPRSFGEFDYELEYLRVIAVQSELKGTDDQVKGWREIYRPQAYAFPPSATTDLLKKHLTEAQQKRFHELMIRRRLLIGGVEGTLGYPLVVEKLKLTGAQLDALRAGARASDILTAEQEKVRPGLLGEPFEFVPATYDAIHEAFQAAKERVGREAEPPAPAKLRPGPGGDRLQPSLARSLLSIPGPLQLTADQIKQLREIAEDAPLMRELIEKELGYPDAQHTAGADRGQLGVHAAQTRYTAAAEARTWQVLDAKQRSLAKEMMGRKE